MTVRLRVAAGQRPCCCPDKGVGPLAALTAPGVEPAPPATIEVPSRPGEVAAYSDFRGSIYRFPMGDGIILNLMHTVAGAYASLTWWKKWQARQNFGQTITVEENVLLDRLDAERRYAQLHAVRHRLARAQPSASACEQMITDWTCTWSR